MTPDQAKQLMDSEKGREMLLPDSRNQKPRDNRHPLKDFYWASILPSERFEDTGKDLVRTIKKAGHSACL